MIKGINGQGHVVVTGGSVSNYVNNFSGAQGVGNMRYNTTNQNIEVYDGNNWLQLQMGYVTVDLSGSAQSAISWAMNKMAEEQRLDELCKKYPGLRKARDNYEIFKRLVEAEEDVSESVQSN